MKKPFDNTKAYREGWAIFDDGEIQRLDEGPIHARSISGTGKPAFDGDAEAIAHVLRKAAKGSRYHKRAIRMAAGLR